MKLKNRETGTIDFVKFEKCSGGEHTIFKLNGEEFTSSDLIMSNLQVVELDRNEFDDFYEFFDDTRFRIIETEEFFEGKMDAYAEMAEENGD